MNVKVEGPSGDVRFRQDSQPGATAPQMAPDYLVQEECTKCKCQGNVRQLYTLKYDLI